MAHRRMDGRGISPSRSASEYLRRGPRSSIYWWLGVTTMQLIHLRIALQCSSLTPSRCQVAGQEIFAILADSLRGRGRRGHYLMFPRHPSQDDRDESLILQARHWDNSRDSFTKQHYRIADCILSAATGEFLKALCEIATNLCYLTRTLQPLPDRPFSCTGVCVLLWKLWALNLMQSYQHSRITRWW